MEHSLAINYTRSSGALSPRDMLLVEQAEYPSAHGRVTKGELAKYIGRQFYGDAYNPSIDCGLNADGSFDTGIYVYPFESVDYRYGASHGTLGDRQIQEFVQPELIRFSLSTRARTKYPAAEVISAVVVGEAFGSDGGPAAVPAITIDGEEIVLSSPVYATVLVRYWVCRHYYSLRVPLREDAVENRYSSVFWAVAAGGPAKYVEIQAPPGAEEFADDSAACGFGGSSTIDAGDDDDDDDEPTTDGNSRVRRVDYCTQEILSDTTY